MDGEATRAESGDDIPVTPERIWAEVARITAAPDFARAPVMRRLLEFLVRATLDGRGEQLKAYAVAVDGLGRSEDFDAQADSYPRVQVGRLRRLLEAFYAREGGGEGMRLSIPSGRYRVLFEADGTPPPEDGAPEPDALDAPPPRAASAQPWWRAPRWAGIALLLLLVAAGIAWMGVRQRAARDGLVEAPVLKLVRLRAPPALDAIEIDADAILLDGLRRGWVARVRGDEALHGGAGGFGAADAAPAYVLGGELTREAHPLLRLRLMRGTGGEMVWTGQVPLPADRAHLREALAPLVAELIQPYGVIATDQRARSAARPAPGYPCILRFDQYRRNRAPALLGVVRDCLARTLALDGGDPMALAASSLLALDARRPDALALARRAVAADPYSAFAHLALARATLAAGKCSAAVRAGGRATTLNPNDPDLAAQVGLVLLQCGDPGAEPLLARAVMLDPNAPAPVYAPLVLLALDRGDVAAARRAADAMAPAPDAASPVEDLVLALVAAAEGDAAKARAEWARVARTDAAAARDPRALLRSWMLPARLQEKALAILRGAGLIAA